MLEKIIQKESHEYDNLSIIKAKQTISDAKIAIPIATTVTVTSTFPLSVLIWAYSDLVYDKIHYANSLTGGILGASPFILFGTLIAGVGGYCIYKLGKETIKYGRGVIDAYKIIEKNSSEPKGKKGLSKILKGVCYSAAGIAGGIATYKLSQIAFGAGTSLAEYGQIFHATVHDMISQVGVGATGLFSACLTGKGFFSLYEGVKNLKNKGVNK